MNYLLSEAFCLFNETRKSLSNVEKFCPYFAVVGCGDQRQGRSTFVSTQSGCTRVMAMQCKRSSKALAFYTLLSKTIVRGKVPLKNIQKPPSTLMSPTR